MNNTIMETFFAVMQQGDNYKTALSLRSMLDDLVIYRLDRIAKEFSTYLEPFSRIESCSYFGNRFVKMSTNDNHYEVDIFAEAEYYQFIFWDPQSDRSKAGEKPAQVVLRKMQLETQFKEGDLYGYHNFQLKRTFKFPTEEEALYQYIREFNQNLNQIVANGSTTKL